MITATGSTGTTIQSVAHSSSAFRSFTVALQDGTEIPNPNNMSVNLLPGQQLFVTEALIASQNMSGQYQDSIWAVSLHPFDGTQHLIGGRPLLASILVSKCSDDVKPSRGAAILAATLTQAGAGLLRITTPADWPTPLRVEIENVLGARVLSGMTDGNTIDATSLATGVYFYRITSGSNVAAGKILIAR